MKLGQIVQLTPRGGIQPLPNPQQSNLARLNTNSADSGKTPKSLAGYVFYPESVYRCLQCWKFIPEQQRCAELGLTDVVRPNGYCTLWSFGTPKSGLTPNGCYTPEQVRYGEDPRGTLCQNCINFRKPNRCTEVQGEIQERGCCNFQQPYLE